MMFCRDEADITNVVSSRPSHTTVTDRTKLTETAMGAMRSTYFCAVRLIALVDVKWGQATSALSRVTCGEAGAYRTLPCRRPRL